MLKSYFLLSLWILYKMIYNAKRTNLKKEKQFSMFVPERQSMKVPCFIIIFV